MHKRGNREGTIRKRGNSWQVSVMLGRKPTGERRTKSFSSSTRAGALKKMHDYMQAIENGETLADDYTIGAWLDLFLELRSASIKPVTLENYGYSAAHIKRYFGENRKISTIGVVDIERMLIALRENYSDATVSQVRGLLFSAFHKAVGERLIPFNPVLYVEKMRKRPRVEKAVFTKEEVVRLFKELPNDRIGNSIRTLLCTGLRCQELLALTCDDIEPDGSKITINRAISMTRGHVSLSSPKSFTSLRTVTVPKIGRDSVMFLRNTTDKFIWQSPVGEIPINPSTFRKNYRACLETIPGIPMLPVHNCRHSYVSFLQAVGVDLATVQSLAGHATKSMSLYYTHVADSTKENAVEKLTALFSNIEQE